MGFTSKTRTVDEIRPFFDKTKSRGPDDSRIEETPSGYLCFHRLAIMGLTPEGMQPFFKIQVIGQYVKQILLGKICGRTRLERMRHIEMSSLINSADYSHKVMVCRSKLSAGVSTNTCRIYRFSCASRASRFSEVPPARCSSSRSWSRP